MPIEGSLYIFWPVIWFVPLKISNQNVNVSLHGHHIWKHVPISPQFLLGDCISTGQIAMSLLNGSRLQQLLWSDGVCSGVEGGHPLAAQCQGPLKSGTMLWTDSCWGISGGEGAIVLKSS